MGGNLRIFRLPEGEFLGFYREQGSRVVEIYQPFSEKLIFAYPEPGGDNRLELLQCVRPPKSVYGREDAIVFRDILTGAERTTSAEYVGYAYQTGSNRYVLRG